MEMDVIIRGGTIVDGSGAAPFTGDIAIRHGRIEEIGKTTASARQTIDAQGAIVTPGFIDVHTHYDGQAIWDETMAPSVQHGVTTAFMGNCGVGFAPLRPGQEEVLIRLMEGVEDIPGTALAEGLDWKWEGFGQYLDRLDAGRRTINVATQVPHDPVRLYVMGERAERREPATSDDIARMRELVKEGLMAGAWAFSTGRTDGHRMADGKDTPASIANEEELVGIASVLKELPFRTLSAVSDFDQAQGGGHFHAEFDLLESMANAAARPITVSWMQRMGADAQWSRIAERATAANARGSHFRLQCAPRGIGTLMSLSTSFNPLLAFATYHAVARLPLAERVQAMRQDAFLKALAQDTPMKLSQAGNAIPPAADAAIQNLSEVAKMMFPIDRGVNYEPDLRTSIHARSLASGRTVVEELALALAAEEGLAFVYFPIYNYLSGDFSVVEQMLFHPLAQLGLGDSGAHVATISDGAFPTFLLQHWVRDRAKGRRLSLERAVQMMTGDQAAHFRMQDRGRLAVGMAADLNVIDLERLSLGMPYVAADLPAGGKRILQDAQGYVATLVAGQVVSRGDQLTGATPGALLRAPLL